MIAGRQMIRKDDPRMTTETTESALGVHTNTQRQAAALHIDLDDVMTIVARAIAVDDSDELLALINTDVADVLHHDAMLCGSGTSDMGGNYLYNLLHHNFPPAYIDALTSADGRTDSPLIQRWRTTLEPIVFQAGRDDDHYPAEWVRTFKLHGFRNTAAQGVLDVRRKFGSYFVFSNIDGEVGAREIFLLKLITPHLHFALMRALTKVQALGSLTGSLQEPMTAQQMEILHWMNQGKTNWEIAQILSMTKNNVKYNIEQILVKLEVKNRAQAVSKAMLIGLLS